MASGESITNVIPSNKGFLRPNIPEVKLGRDFQVLDEVAAASGEPTHAPVSRRVGPRSRRRR